MTDSDRSKFLKRVEATQGGYRMLQNKYHLFARPVVRFPKNKAGLVGRFSLFLLRGCGAVLDIEYRDKKEG